MDTQQNTALTRALAEVPGPLPTSGVIHIAIPHTDRFTIVGNHLAQHPDLSCTAVGIAVRIQSLPQGVEVGIKALAARCREGEKRVAAALRELEAFGYLQRIRDRLPSGRVITRTVFCNQPTALLRPRRPAAPQHPAKLLKHRLTALLPPPLPGAHDLTAPARPRITVTPFQTCDDCDRAFRSPTPGHCRDCREHREHREHRSEDARSAA
ncbi:hypothetical protein [Streptomyces anulatus]|uniref:hypothetical protein n=1 Tax=Streptomyces anulatus TaxID=1892 RepID=UPI00386C6EC7